MIYIHDLLRVIRKMKGYRASAIAYSLTISTQTFYILENEFRAVDKLSLVAWLKALDIPKAEHDWYVQKYNREVQYEHLRQNNPFDIPEPLLQKLADIMTFHKKIDISQLETQLLKHTLPYVLIRPRTADIAFERIHTEQ